MTSNKKVNLYDLRGNYLRTFNSLTECAWWFGSHLMSICESLQGTGFHKYYQLRYYQGNTDNIPSWIKDKDPFYTKVYYLTDRDGNESEFESTLAVAEYLGVSRELVRQYSANGKWFCKKKFKVKRSFKLVNEKHG